MTPREVLVVAHVRDAPLAVIEPAAAEQGLTLDVRRPVFGDPLPDAARYAGLIVLGGPQSAYDAEKAYLAAEMELLAAAHRGGIPILAICLGCQLLACALGGEAYPGESGLECGFIDVRATVEEGEPLAGRFFSFHSDTFRVPAGGVVLARSDRYVQAWRSGSALAVQFHPEMDRAGVEALLDLEEEKLARFGVDIDALRAENDHASEGPGSRLLADWMGSLPSAQPAPTS